MLVVGAAIDSESSHRLPSVLPYTRFLRRFISAAGRACIGGSHSTGKDAQPKHLVFAQDAVSLAFLLSSREACACMHVSWLEFVASARFARVGDGAPQQKTSFPPGIRPLLPSRLESRARFHGPRLVTPTHTERPQPQP